MVIMPYRVTVQENGRVVLPAMFRKALGLEKGRRHQLLLEIVDGQGVIRTELNQVRDLQSRFKSLRRDESAVDELERTRRREAALETKLETQTA